MPLIIFLTPPTQLTLERALEFIEDDELVEVTPHHLRLRKRYLKENERKLRIARPAESANPSCQKKRPREGPFFFV